jgi:hypothetical protein
MQITLAPAETVRLRKASREPNCRTGEAPQPSIRVGNHGSFGPALDEPRGFELLR